ncbi:hypothetical protein ACO22_02487 [Paracoccidioides brasiliensis]|uniref:Uncharacterized protein n=1 Tax=Paracoccidioides brasiliensis TaxID=121759 RepID=A0A1D2JII6_PARBR|nr:hypothetical protein ACO22_02487 [Paracoccidioides brasiliensis]
METCKKLVGLCLSIPYYLVNGRLFLSPRGRVQYLRYSGITRHNSSLRSKAECLKKRTMPSTTGERKPRK